MRNRVGVASAAFKSLLYVVGPAIVLALVLKETGPAVHDTSSAARRHTSAAAA